MTYPSGFDVEGGEDAYNSYLPSARKIYITVLDDKEKEILWYARRKGKNEGFFTNRLNDFELAEVTDQVKLVQFMIAIGDQDQLQKVLEDHGFTTKGKSFLMAARQWEAFQLTTFRKIEYVYDED